ncbi:MAG TPA: hypothetical protein VFG54_09600 [Prolixibacteraceae bacterium]|nr:hypothetical protein [Prolixibacteraceae bacterium]
MNQYAEERIRIIKKLKPSIYVKEQPLDQRIKILRFFGWLKYLLANVLLIALIIQSALSLLQHDPSGESWQKSALLVFITLNLSLQSHYSYIEYLLLKHVLNLKNQQYSISYINNKELKELIIRLNHNRLKPYWIILPSILVMVGSIFTYFDSNPYWEIFALPVLLVGILLSIRLNKDVLLVRNNIEHIESKVVLNSIKS